ncbi:MAG: hypothetical protein AB7D57_09805, partial [Desulfovibrionaceae bacterium]
ACRKALAPQSNSQKAGRVPLDLRHAKVEVLQDSPASWPEPGALRLEGFRYARIDDNSPTDFRTRKQWLDRLPRDGRFRPQPYEQLADVLRRAGYEEDAKLIHMEKHRAKVKAEQWIWRSAHKRLLNFLFRITVGYGYEPWRALWWMLVFVLLGWSLFSWGHQDGIMVEFQGGRFKSEQLQGEYAPHPYPTFNAFIYSLDAFIPLVDLHQEIYWMPNSESLQKVRIRPIDWYWPAWTIRVYLWVHILAGWVLTLLFVAGVSGLVRRMDT